MHRIAFVLSANNAGGLERVMITLANELSMRSDLEVYLILLLKKEHFFEINKNVIVVEPAFTLSKTSRLGSIIKTFFYLRHQLKSIHPASVISFGGKYNWFVILSSIRLGVKVYISDRSKPSISYGRFLDLLIPIVYKKASGIVAQTKQAKNYLTKITNHANIIVIGNPIEVPTSSTNWKEREHIILNVGRFIKSKKQEWLIDYFDQIEDTGWKLVFLGDGPELERIKEYAMTKNAGSRIEFLGNVSNVDEWYQRAKIFAFTSISEGFPNALAEAMANGCACISYNCEAGPEDIIDDQLNGYLIKEADHNTYYIALNKMCTDEVLGAQFSMAAREKMKEFELTKIAKSFYNFINS